MSQEEKMSTVVTFDTNFIIENKDKIKTIILDVKEKYELVIAKIVRVFQNAKTNQKGLHIFQK